MRVSPEMAREGFGHNAPAGIPLTKEKYFLHGSISQGLAALTIRPFPGPKPRVRPADPVRYTCPGLLFLENI